MVKDRSKRSLCCILLTSATLWSNISGVFPRSNIFDFRAGKWHPDSGHLARIRHTIDRRPKKFKKPFQKTSFKKLFGGLDGLLTTEDRLKTAPKVYCLLMCLIAGICEGSC
jgi:hypothetical protein